MVEPGTAAIAVLSTIAGISGYGAMKVNSKQNVMIEAEIQRRIQGVRDLLKATETAKTIAEKSLQTQKSEVARLASELKAIKTAKESLERQKPPPPPSDSTPPPPPPPQAKEPAKSFLDSVDTITSEADLRETELKKIEDIIAERLKEAESDKTTEGKIVIGRLKKAADTARRTRERVRTARTKLKDTASSYDKKVRDARKTLRSRRPDPEDVEAAKTTLRLPPSEIQEEVSSTLDDVGSVKLDLDDFLQGNRRSPPTTDSVDKDTKAVMEDQKARKEQVKEQAKANDSAPRRLPTQTSRKRKGFDTRKLVEPTPEAKDGRKEQPTVDDKSIPKTVRPQASEDRIVSQQDASKDEVKVAVDKDERERCKQILDSKGIRNLVAWRKWSLENKNAPDRNIVNNCATIFFRSGGKLRKNKLRTRRGNTQNGRGTRRSKNRANRTHSNTR